MPTQKGGYYTQDGKRVPSVTTILSHCALGGCDGLVAWAANLAKEGKDWREARDAAADAGTLCHAAAEAWVHEQPFAFEGSPEVVERAQRSFSAFLEWARQTNFKVARAELPLVSEKYRYGGTFDCLLVNGRRAMGDYKTSNSVQSKFLIQIAAYGKLWEEHFPEEPINGGYVLLRFSREFGDFTQKWWPELDSAWKAFLHMRELYELGKELKKRAA